MSQPTPSHEQITQDVTRIIQAKLESTDTGFEGSIAPSAHIVGDLGLESVAIVEICMAIGKHFQRKLPFQELVFRDLKFQDFTIEEMVAFIERQLART